MRGTRGDRRKLVALVLAAAVVFAIAFVGVTSGFGGPDLPEGDIAFVDDMDGGDITQEQFDAAFEQAAARQGLRRPPEAGTPQYDVIKEAAISDLILGKWVEGEAQERGIEVSDAAVEDELERIREEQFGNQKEWQRFLRQQRYTEEDALQRVRLQLLSTRIQERLLNEDIEVTDDEVTEYYDSNIAQFEQPESRDVRVITTNKQQDAQRAFDQLSDDDSAGAWRRAAKRFSTDEATANAGGLRQAVVQGQNEPALDQAIFSASVDELVGPIEGDSNFYVLQVTNVTEASTQELDDQTREQIRQTLVAQRQQQLASDFQTDFAVKWTGRTVCAEDYLIERCANAEPPPDACTGDDDGEEPPTDAEGNEQELGCPAFVPSIRPVEPGTAGNIGATGRPQGPITSREAPAMPQGIDLQGLTGGG